METPSLAPPLSASATVAPPPHLPYPDSVDSSPRSRTTDSWDEPPYAGGAPVSSKLRLMCSYGGHIVPRPHDKSLCYVGGDTRIVVVDRITSLSDLAQRLSKTLIEGRSFTLKYQLPNEDLDSLISVTTDEDLEIMIDEYDRLNSSSTTATRKSSRLRLFLFPTKPESGSSIGSLLDNSTKSEDWFLNALNGSSGGFSESSSVNCLLGLDDDMAANAKTNSSEKGVEARIESYGDVKGPTGGTNKQAQDVHSVPDSPMLETSSSFGSTSSSPSLANLPPIRVHVEDQKVGVEEQFSQMNVGYRANVQQQKQDDGGFTATVFTTAPATAAVSCVPVGGGMVIGEYPNRILSDDERSEQGLPFGYRKPPQSQGQPQFLPTQLQQKQTGGFDLASPDSVSSDGSLANPLSYQRPMIYQDSISTMSHNQSDPKITDPSSRVQIQQVHDSGYSYSPQFDQQHLQLHQQPQFVHATPQYIHHQPAGNVPSYYSMYPPQQQPPLYYMHAGHTQAYSMPVQPSSYTESTATSAATSRPQTPPPTSMVPNPVRNAPAPAGVYKAAAGGAQQMMQVPVSQHQQYVGYSQVHHPSQSSSASNAAAFGYEYADPAHGQMYYTQPLAPQLAAQYQTLTSVPAGVLPEGENMKQQIRTSQP